MPDSRAAPATTPALAALGLAVVIGGASYLKRGFDRGMGMRPAWQHPAGYAWYSFDAAKIDANDVEPDAVEPSSE